MLNFWLKIFNKLKTKPANMKNNFSEKGLKHYCYISLFEIYQFEYNWIINVDVVLKSVFV